MVQDAMRENPETHFKLAPHEINKKVHASECSSYYKPQLLLRFGFW